MVDEDIKDDRSARETVRGKLNKQKKLLLDALEHHTRRKERQDGEALKMWVKLT